MPTPVARWHYCLAGAKYVTKNSNFDDFWSFLVQKMVQKKLSLRGWDLSGEIRAEILHRTPLRMSKTVGWRPDWYQKGVIWGPLGFRAALAHPNQPTNHFFSSSPAMCGHHVSHPGTHLVNFFIIIGHVWPSCVTVWTHFFHPHQIFQAVVSAW